MHPQSFGYDRETDMHDRDKGDDADGRRLKNEGSVA